MIGVHHVWHHNWMLWMPIKMEQSHWENGHYWWLNFCCLQIIRYIPILCTQSETKSITLFSLIISHLPIFLVEGSLQRVIKLYSIYARLCPIFWTHSYMYIYLRLIFELACVGLCFVVESAIFEQDIRFQGHLLDSKCLLIAPVQHVHLFKLLREP